MLVVTTHTRLSHSGLPSPLTASRRGPRRSSHISAGRRGQPGRGHRVGGGRAWSDPLKALIAFHVDPDSGRWTNRCPIRAHHWKRRQHLSITLHGPGGHTSRPHKTVDLVDTAAKVVSELPAAVRRSIDARSAIVVVFGSVHGGNVSNVIPTEVVLRGNDPHPRP